MPSERQLPDTQCLSPGVGTDRQSAFTVRKIRTLRSSRRMSRAASQAVQKMSGKSPAFRIPDLRVSPAFRVNSENPGRVRNQKRCVVQAQSDDPKRGRGITAPGIWDTADAQACSRRNGVSLNQTSTRGHFMRR